MYNFFKKQEKIYEEEKRVFKEKVRSICDEFKKEYDGKIFRYKNKFYTKLHISVDYCGSMSIQMTELLDSTGNLGGYKSIYSSNLKDLELVTIEDVVNNSFTPSGKTLIELKEYLEVNGYDIRKIAGRTGSMRNESFAIHIVGDNEVDVYLTHLRTKGCGIKFVSEYTTARRLGAEKYKIRDFMFECRYTGTHYIEKISVHPNEKTITYVEKEK